MGGNMLLKDGKIIFEDSDVMDYTNLGEIIADWVEKFKEVHQNHPLSGVPGEYLPRDFTHSDEELEVAVQVFHKDLAEVIHSFRSEEPEIPDGIFEHKDNRIVVADEKLYAEYQQAEQEWEDRVKNGRELFARIFPTLWI